MCVWAWGTKQNGGRWCTPDWCCLRDGWPLATNQYGVGTVCEESWVGECVDGLRNEW